MTKSKKPKQVIRQTKGKASKPTEFGKMVKIQEAENQIIIGIAGYQCGHAFQALLMNFHRRDQMETRFTPISWALVSPCAE
jgi:hypothetical protein